MKLREIDKERYSKHYKIAFAAITVELCVASILCSTLLIRWFSTPDKSHMMLNAFGVVFAALIASYALYRFRDHPFMDELVYVWNLKKQLNYIQRKQRKIEPLIEENHLDAMVVMNFMYQGSMQLYKLDDNTITLNELAIKAEHLNTKVKENGFTLSTDDYRAELLDQF